MPRTKNTPAMPDRKRLYFNALGIEPAPAPEDHHAQKAALDRAYEMRSFEIGLVWTRATYFFTSQAAIFAAFALLFKEPGFGTSCIAGLLALLGLATAWLSYLSARGSRFWQQNWEHHIDLLEGELEGDLHKTVFKKKTQVGYSVSRSQITLTLAQIAFWIIVLMAVPYRLIQIVAASASTPTKIMMLELAYFSLFVALWAVRAITSRALGSQIVGEEADFRPSLKWKSTGGPRDYVIIRRESAAGWPAMKPGISRPPLPASNADPAGRSATGRTSGNPKRATTADK